MLKEYKKLAPNPWFYEKAPETDRKKWHDELVKGIHKQGKGWLRTIDGKFCCLGIGCLVFEGHVAEDQRLPSSTSRFALRMGNAANSSTQNQYKPAIAIKTSIPPAVINGPVLTGADVLNDSYDFTFHEIAMFVWPEGYSETGEKLL